jgi:tetratricopeptide (TPR) repeat protein
MPLLVGGVILAMAAMGGAIYFAFSGTGNSSQGSDPNSTAQASDPNDPGTKKPEPPKPTPAAPSAQEKANRLVLEALALEKAKREGDAVNQIDTALEDRWPEEARTLLTDARTIMIDRFKGKVTELKVVIKNGETARARSMLADLRGRCPDTIGFMLADCETQLNGAIASNPRPDKIDRPSDTPQPSNDTPKDAPRADDTPKPADTPKSDKPNKPEKPAKGDKPEKPDDKKDDDPGKGDKEDSAVSDKVEKVRSILMEEDGKIADAQAIIAELEKLAPNSPAVKGARGLVLYAQRKYEEAQEDLAAGLAADPKDDRVRFRLATSLFLYGHYEEARELVKDVKETGVREIKGKGILRIGEWGDQAAMARLRYLIDGPWCDQYPLSHAALEGKTPNGKYSIMTDMGLELGGLDKFEREMEKAPADKRVSKLEDFRRAHFGQKEAQRFFEAAYKAYTKLFKIKDAPKDAKSPAEIKKEEEAAKKAGATMGREGSGAKDMKLPPNHGRVVRVYIFREKAEFAAFSKKIGIGSTENILGYFMPATKILAFYREESRETALITKELHNVLFHEAFHQFLDLFIEDAPPWFNEGCAEYFGISELTPNGLRYGLVPDGTQGGSRYTNLQEVINPAFKSMYGQECPTLFTVMKMDHSDFMVHGGTNYALAWGLVHYFASTKPGQKKLKAYFRGLRDGLPADQMFRKVFGDIDQGRLEADFRQHVGDMAFNRPPPDDSD